jgi:hypothetical protein
MTKKTADEWLQNFEMSKVGQKYQTVIENPTLTQIITNIRPSSILYSAGFVTLAGLGGFYFGKHIRPQNMMLMLSFQAFSSFIICAQSSFKRLKGYSPNEVELKRYGIEKKEIVAIIQKRKYLSQEEMLKNESTYFKDEK